MLIFMLIVTMLAILVHLALMKKRTAKKVVEVVLLYLLVISLGTGSLIAGLMHVFNGPRTAAMIGWPAGSPFQFEVGVADIAFGVVGILCLFVRGNFWLAAIAVNSTFLLGCMIGHVHDAVASGNLAAYNIGPNIFIADMIVPLALLVLYAVYRQLKA
jgi:hypothetical protein